MIRNGKLIEHYKDSVSIWQILQGGKIFKGAKLLLCVMMIEARSLWLKSELHLIQNVKNQS